MKKLFTLSIVLLGFVSTYAQTSLPVIGVVIKGQVKNVIQSNSLQNDMKFLINNTGAAPLQFYVAANASATAGTQGVSVAAGQQRSVSVSDLGGISLGQYINVVNNAINGLIPGSFKFDLDAPSSGCANNALIGTIYQKIGTNDYFFCDPLTAVNTSTIYRLGIGTSTPGKNLEVIGNGSFTGDLTVGGPITTPSDIFATNLTTTGNIINSGNITNSGNLLVQNGYVGIGTTNPGTCKLAVEGMIGAREVRVILGNFPDYVFAKDYKLSSLKEVEAYINKNHHLPGIQSAADVEANDNGVKLGELNVKMLEKIEELTLYAIEQNKKLEQLQKEMEKLRVKTKK